MAVPRGGTEPVLSPLELLTPSSPQSLPGSPQEAGQHAVPGFEAWLVPPVPPLTPPLCCSERFSIPSGEPPHQGADWGRRAEAETGGERPGWA